MSAKINNKKLVRDIKHVVENNLETAFIPMQKGDKIYIGNIMIKKEKNKFLLFDKVNNKAIAKTSFKNSALALAKNYALNKGRYSTILELDKALEKHYMDMIFYKNTIRKNKNSNAVFAAETRLDISSRLSQKCCKEIERHIFF